MSMQTKQRAAAGMMTGAAALAIAGFTALGSIFDYPQILKAPTPEILDSYRENQTAITGWFLALVISAALLAPIGVLLGRIAGGILGKWITGVGIAAATVQVIGLSRWVLLIPGISDDATVPALTAKRPPHLRTTALLARHHPRRNRRLRPHRDLHCPRRHRLHPQCRDHQHHRHPVDRLPRLRLSSSDRHRCRHSAGHRRCQHHQLHRLRHLVPLAHRHGRGSLAHTCDGSEPDDHNSGSAVHRNAHAVNPASPESSR